MTKRFTEAEKWRDKWFRALRPEFKLAWMYILDNCDCAGVIDLDEDLANFQIGCELDWERFFDLCGETRIERMDNGKWFIVRFVEYQYGKLSPECRPHAPVINKLREHGINDVRQKGEFKRGSVTKKRRLEVIERDECICCYCGKEFDASELQPDHVIPASKGGTDAKDNLVAACGPCNSKKWDKDLPYFISTLDDPDGAIKRLSQRVSKRVFDTLKEKEQEQVKEQDTEQEQVKVKDGGAGGRKAKKETSRPADITEQAWADWKSVRDAKRGGPITLTALDGLRSEAKKAGISIQDAIEICVRRSWVGFEAKWLASEQNPRSHPSGHQKTFAELSVENSKRAIQEFCGG